MRGLVPRKLNLHWRYRNVCNGNKLGCGGLVPGILAVGRYRSKCTTAAMPVYLQVYLEGRVSI